MYVQASKFFNQLNMYSPEANRWTQVVTDNCPDGIAGHGATIVGDLMVVFGGYHGHGNRLNSVVSDVPVSQLGSLRSGAVKK